MDLRLIQETEGSPAPPEGTLLNAPASPEPRWRVEGRMPRRTAVRRDRWTQELLEDMDMFDAAPGWRVFGADAPDILRAEGHSVDVATLADQRAHAQRAREVRTEREAELQRAWDERLEQVAAHEALLARLTDGLQRTDYSRYWTIESVADLEVVDRLPSSQTLAPWQWDEGVILNQASEQQESTLFRAPEGIVRQRTGSNYSVELWAEADTADRVRAERAAEMEIGPDEAVRGLASRYVGEDQRRMYLVALAPEQRGPALLEALRKLSATGTCPWCEGTGDPQPGDGSSRCGACHGSRVIREASLDASRTVAAWAAECGASPEAIATASASEQSD